MEQNSQSAKTERSCQKKIALFRQKEKTHTVQNQITVNLDGVIIHKSAHSPGSHHDYKIYKAKHPVLSEEMLQFYDLGFGNSKRLSRPNQHLPYKKRRTES